MERKKIGLFILFVLLVTGTNIFAQTIETKSSKITEFPWLENFEDIIFPPMGWGKYIPDQVNDITQSSFTNHTAQGEYSARFSSYNYPSSNWNQYLFSPDITVEANYTTLSFWTREHQNLDEHFAYGIGTTTNPDDYTWNEITLTGEEWSETIVDLTPYIGQTVHICFRYFSENVYFVYLDDVKIYNENCTPPTTQASNFSATTDYNDMEINWTRGDGDNVLIIAKKDADVDVFPENGITYNADANFGSSNEIGIGNYVIYNGTNSSVNVTGLETGTTYYFAVYEYNTLDYCYLSPPLLGSAATKGFVYCEAGSLNYSEYDYIARVQFGDIDNSTGCEEYADYTTLSTDVIRTQTYTITVTNNYAMTGNDSNDLGIWIDWNQDGDFDDAGENVVCNIDVGEENIYINDITVPADAVFGRTTMRIRQKWNGADCGSPCGDADISDVEDYSVNIINENTVTEQTNQNINIYPNPTNGKFTISGNEIQIDNINVTVTDIAGKIILQADKSVFDLSDYPKGIYNIIIKTDNIIVNKLLIVK